MVDGTTTLGEGNDVDVLAADVDGTVFFNDVDGLTIGTVTEGASGTNMSITGITTSNDDVKLVVGDAAGEHLVIDADVDLGAGDLFLDVAGNVTQLGDGKAGDMTKRLQKLHREYAYEHGEALPLA